jgi:hypothetical protein
LHCGFPRQSQLIGHKLAVSGLVAFVDDAQIAELASIAIAREPLTNFCMHGGGV